MLKFASGGKQRPKKELGLITMQAYPDVYVASISLEANYNQVGEGCVVMKGAGWGARQGRRQLCD